MGAGGTLAVGDRLHTAITLCAPIGGTTLLLLAYHLRAGSPGIDDPDVAWL